MEGIRRNEVPPLENQLILDTVFQHCGFAELKSCQCVSKLWKEFSLKQWRATSKVILVEERMASFLQFIKDKNNKFAKYPWDHFIVRCESSLFWEQVGRFIKTLEINQVTFKSVANFQAGVYKSCPNLEDLTLLFVKMKKKTPVLEPELYISPVFPENKKLKSLTIAANQMDMGISWMEIFNHYPTLEAMTIRCGTANYMHLFRSLNIIRNHDATKLMLKRIDIKSVFELTPSVPVVREFLVDPRLHLESLSISASNVDHDGLRNIISTHASTLKFLFLMGTRGRTPSLTLSVYQRLDNIQELVFRAYDTRGTSMAFLKCVPNLKKLVMWNDNHASFGNGSSLDVIRNTRQSDMGRFTSNCRKLELNWPAEVLSREDILCLTTWLPNIEDLNLTVKLFGNEQFAVVCERWTQIKSLSVIGWEVDGSGITGLDPEDVQRIDKMKEKGSWRPITVPKVNITNLKGLERLFVVINNICYLGYCSAVHGIEKLRNLKYLRLVGDNKGKCWQAVEDKFPWN